MQAGGRGFDSPQLHFVVIYQILCGEWTKEHQVAKPSTMGNPGAARTPSHPVEVRRTRIAGSGRNSDG